MREQRDREMTERGQRQASNVKVRLWVDDLKLAINMFALMD